jgi:hypothetical protein
MTKKKQSINKEPIIIAHDKYIKCNINHCRPDDKTIADNFKIKLEHTKCLKRASKVKKSKRISSLKKCSKGKFNNELKKIIKCSAEKCNKEKEEVTKLMNNLLDIEDKLKKKLDSCAKLKCTNLIKEYEDIIEKCNIIKSFKKRIDCKYEPKVMNIRNNVTKCKKKNCSKQHKELTKQQSLINKILTKINKENTKINKKNERVYNKYYSPKTKKKSISKKRT